MSKVWKAGAYLRLSHDDDDYDEESMSIINQKSLINDWLDGYPDINVVDVYIDDGYTGTNFERPGYIDMMFDINLGRINCVIVKDLSRLGRNTSKISKLKDEVFPSKGVRFVAINDNIDTRGGIDENDMSDFKMVFNEYYVKDISKKVKSALRTSAKRGNYVGALAPYGYKKSIDDYHKLVIDNQVAPIVKRIFYEYSIGNSGREIAENLNKDGIATPYNYRLISKDKNIDNSKCWTSNTVLQIIRNEVYYGDLVQHTREKISYKLTKRRVTLPDERIVVENAHEAIIDELTEYKVKKRLENSENSKRKKRKNGEILPVMFSGLLICDDCGSKLAATIKHDKRCYRCSKYNTAGSSACSSHLIYEEDLMSLIMTDLKRLLWEYNKSPQKFKETIFEVASTERITEINKAKFDIVDYKNKINEIQKTMSILYKDKTNGVISHEMFSVIAKKYDDELKELFTLTNNCDNIIKKSGLSDTLVEKWIIALKSIEECKSINKKQIESLIDCIIINGVSSKERIRIKYNVGFLDFNLQTPVGMLGA